MRKKIYFAALISLSIFSLFNADIAKSSSPQSSLQWNSMLQDLSAVKIYGDQELQRFDAELNLAFSENKNGFLAASTSYTSLLALRTMEENFTHEILEKRNANPRSWNQFLKNLKNFSAGKLTPALEAIRSESNDALSFEKANLTELPKISEKNRLALLQRFSDKFQAEISKLRLIVMETNPIFEKIADRKKYAPGIDTMGTISGGNYPANSFSLTFDDGPRKATTPLIFENLKRSGVLATFFWLGQLAPSNQSLVDLAKTNDFSLNNHSFTHRSDFGSRLNDADLEHEVGDSYRVLSKSFGISPRFFRCPYGAGVNNERVRTKIASYNMIHVLWNIDSLDWKDKNPDSILDRVKKQMAIEKRGVILMHDIHPQTVEASKKLLNYTDSLKGTTNEIHWITVSKFVDDYNNNN